MAITSRGILACAVPAVAVVVVSIWLLTKKKKKPSEDPDLSNKKKDEPLPNNEEETILRNWERIDASICDNDSVEKVEEPSKVIQDETCTDNHMDLEEKVEKEVPTESSDISSTQKDQMNDNVVDVLSSLQFQSEPQGCDVIVDEAVAPTQVASVQSSSVKLPSDELDGGSQEEEEEESISPVAVSSDMASLPEAPVLNHQEEESISQVAVSSDMASLPEAPVLTDDIVNSNVNVAEATHKTDEDAEDGNVKNQEELIDISETDDKQQEEIMKADDVANCNQECAVEPQRENHVNGIHSPSDSTSEVSTDSGHGNSEADNRPSPLEDEPVCFQFEFPSRLCGKLVGKNGRNVIQIKKASGAEVTLLQHPFYNPEYQICTLEGSETAVASALDLIKERFPPARNTDITYESFNAQPDLSHPVLSSQLMELKLSPGIFNDVVISSIVDATHFFVQQPAHPTFPSLESLNQLMLACYQDGANVPGVPTPIEVGVICAAPMMDGWYRAQIIAFDEHVLAVDVKYMDYGGYGRVPLSTLKQIRSDFMTIPFQACECYSANIAQLNGEQTMSVEASAVLEEMCQNSILQCEVLSYDEQTSVPYVYLYKISNGSNVFINRELVNRGVARWIE